jgi:RNA polymerase sigma-70 factor (ECF subfamily)
MTADIASVNRIIEEWQAGLNREENFRLLFDQYAPLICRFFEKRGFSTEECRDLTQETFICVYKGVETFRRESQFETWLFQIASNIYRTELRRRLADKRAGQHASWESTVEQEQSASERMERGHPASRQNPLDEVLAKEGRRLLREAMEELPDQMRNCLMLRVYQGFSYQEIAAAMQISVETVKAHLYQARHRLKSKLADYFTEPDF